MGNLAQSMGVGVTDQEVELRDVDEDPVLVRIAAGAFWAAGLGLLVAFWGWVWRWLT